VGEYLSVARSPDVVVLAGGRGTRLRPLTGDLPKVLAPVGGRPFLECLLGHVARCGFSRVILAVGYRADAVRAAVDARRPHGVEVLYSEEAAPLGTGGALRLGAGLVSTPDALVLNGDSLLVDDLRFLVRAHRGAQLDVTLALVKVNNVARFGLVETAAGGRVVRYAEKDRSGPGWISAGTYVMRAEWLRAIPSPSSLERDVLPHQVERGMFSLRSGAPFVDIGEPDAYRDARLRIAGLLPWLER